MERLGNYLLLSVLEEGAIADVYLAAARDEASGSFRKVLIKRLRQEFARDPDVVVLFLDEARLLLRLDHPNTVRTFDLGQSGEEYFVVMEDFEGESLASYRGAVNGIPLTHHVAIVAQALHGLHHAHTLHDAEGNPLALVHRDVTPRNICVTYDGLAKVVDFGMARAVGRVAETRVGMLKGKAIYMSPERARHELADHLTDIFSVGAVLWEALAGRSMWEGMSDADILGLLVRGLPAPSPSIINPEVPHELEAACMRALAPSPDDRWPTAAEMAGALEAWLRRAGGIPRPEQIGLSLSSAFQAKRAQREGFIEAQLGLLRNDGASASAGHSAIPNVSSTGDLPTAVHSTASEGLPILVRSSPESWDPRALGDRAGRGTRRAKRRAVIAALGIAVLVAGGTALIVSSLAQPSLSSTLASAAGTKSASEDAGAAAPPPPTAPAPASDDAGPHRLRLSLRATPPQAEFRIDDGPPLTNPYEGHVDADAKPHTIHATAKGYRPWNETVRFETDVSLEVSLGHDDPAGGRPPTKKPHGLPGKPRRK